MNWLACRLLFPLALVTPASLGLPAPAVEFPLDFDGGASSGTQFFAKSQMSLKT